MKVYVVGVYQMEDIQEKFTITFISLDKAVALEYFHLQVRHENVFHEMNEQTMGGYCGPKPQVQFRGYDLESIDVNGEQFDLIKWE